MSGPASSILVVDDNDDIRETVAEILEQNGYATATAVHGLDALQQLRQGHIRPDLIILDLMMPVMDGWHFRAEQLRDPALREIPVIVLTAYAPTGAADGITAQAFLRKPVALDTLLATVERVSHPPG